MNEIEELIENLEENGCLEDYKVNVIKEFVKSCVMWVNSVPVIDTHEVNERYGEDIIKDINQAYLMHYARGIK